MFLYIKYYYSYVAVSAIFLISFGPWFFFTVDPNIGLSFGFRSVSSVPFKLKGDWPGATDRLFYLFGMPASALPFCASTSSCLILTLSWRSILDGLLTM